MASRTHPLERAATLAELDETERTAFLNSFPLAEDLALTDTEELSALFGDSFPVHKRRRLLSIKKFIARGHALEETTSLQTVVNRLEESSSVAPAAIREAIRVDMSEGFRMMAPEEVRMASFSSATPLLSPCEFGHMEMANARAADLVVEFEPVDGQPAVFTQSEINEIAGCDDEQEMVAFFTPCLEALVADIPGKPRSHFLIVKNTRGSVHMGETRNMTRSLTCFFVTRAYSNQKNVLRQGHLLRLEGQRSSSLESLRTNVYKIPSVLCLKSRLGTTIQLLGKSLTMAGF